MFSAEICEGVVFARWSRFGFFPCVLKDFFRLESREEGIEGALDDNEVGNFEFLQDIRGIDLATGDNEEDDKREHSSTHVCLDGFDIFL